MPAKPTPVGSPALEEHLAELREEKDLGIRMAHIESVLAYYLDGVRAVTGEAEAQGAAEIALRGLFGYATLA